MKSCDSHSHQKCVDKLIKQAREICIKNNLRLTPLREKILEIIFQNHKAIKAYDVLKELEKHNISDKPPTIYRALDFFITNKIIHKIHCINSYLVCSHPGMHNDCSLFICEKCNSVEENCDNNISKLIVEDAKNNNFTIKNKNIEILGICQNCQK